MNATLYDCGAFFGIEFANGTEFYIRKDSIEPPVPLGEDGAPLDPNLHHHLMQRSAYDFRHKRTRGEC
jgi:hypothetical protein